MHHENVHVSCIFWMTKIWRAKNVGNKLRVFVKF